MTFTTIKNVKSILAAAPINLHLGYIRNLSWIDKQILEILVDSNHAPSIKNRIGKSSEYDVKSDLDPLSAKSFHWDDDIRPQSKEAILKRNFVLRLSASMISTKQESTRQYIMDWANNRGIGQQLRQQLQKAGIVVSTDNSNPTPIPCLVNGQQNPSAAGSKSRSKLKINPITPRAPRYTKRKLSISSDEGLPR